MNKALNSEFPDAFNIATYLLNRNLKAGRANKTAIIWEDISYSYYQVHALSNSVGNALKELGVRIGDRIFFSDVDLPSAIIGFLGTLKLGAIAVPVRTGVSAKEYVHCLEDSRSVVAIVSATRLPIILEHKDQLPCLRHVISTDARVEGYLSFSSLLRFESTHLDVAQTHKDDPAFIFYSSGTTGLPKAIVHLHETVAHAAQPIFDLNTNDIFYSLAQISHTYGLYGAFLLPFTVGGTVVGNTAVVGAVVGSKVIVREKSGVRRIFETIARYKPTVFFGVPRAYAGLLAASLPEDHMRSVRLCFSASEPMPKKLWTDFKERFGVEILDGLGSTEAISFYICNRPGAIRPGSSGQIMPSFEAKIVDENGNPVQTGQVGELWIRGPSLFAYYWHDHQRTISTRQGEWFKTGDLYHVDADGYYWYHGRIGDMIKAGGWVSPIELESLLLEHPAVQDVGVVGRMDKDELIKPCAYIVLKPGYVPSEALAKEILSFAEERLDEYYKYPRWVEFVDALPYTSTGKLQRFKLRQLPSANLSH